METVLPVGPGEAPGQRIAVNLRAEVTEIGTLVLSCVERSGQRRTWTLEFNVRLRKDEQDQQSQNLAGSERSVGHTSS